MQIFVRWITPYTIISKLHSRYTVEQERLRHWQVGTAFSGRYWERRKKEALTEELEGKEKTSPTSRLCLGLTLAMPLKITLWATGCRPLIYTVHPASMTSTCLTKNEPQYTNEKSFGYTVIKSGKALGKSSTHKGLSRFIPSQNVYRTHTCPVNSMCYHQVFTLYVCLCNTLWHTGELETM